MNQPKGFSDLENILPRGWSRDFLGESVNDFNNSRYRTITHNHPLIGVYLQKVFDKDIQGDSFFENNKKKIFSILQGLNDATEKKVKVGPDFGQDYTSLIETTNEIVESILRDKATFTIDNITDSNTNGIHSYAPIISFIKKIHNNDLSGKNILEIGARSYGVSALSYLNSLGAEVHALDSSEKPGDNILKNNNIDYVNGRWENVSKIFNDESMDIIYINYMYPSPYGGGPFSGISKLGPEYILNMFEAYIAKETHKVLKPNGLYIMRNWGSKDKREYLYVNRDNFNQYNLSTYPIESFDEAKRITINVGEDITENKARTLKEHSVSLADIRTYPLNPDDKDLYFGTKLIVFQKKA
jgi:predicted SAM-dependent methyltransferase